MFVAVLLHWLNAGFRVLQTVCNRESTRKRQECFFSKQCFAALFSQPSGMTVDLGQLPGQKSTYYLWRRGL